MCWELVSSVESRADQNRSCSLAYSCREFCQPASLFSHFFSLPIQLRHRVTWVYVSWTVIQTFVVNHLTCDSLTVWTCHGRLLPWRYCIWPFLVWSAGKVSSRTRRLSLFCCHLLVTHWLIIILCTEAWSFVFCFDYDAPPPPPPPPPPPLKKFNKSFGCFVYSGWNTKSLSLFLSPPPPPAPLLCSLHCTGATTWQLYPDLPISEKYEPYDKLLGTPMNLIMYEFSVC